MDIVHRLRDDKIARGSINPRMWIGFSKYLNNYRPDCKVQAYGLATKYRNLAKVCWMSEIEKVYAVRSKN